MVASSIVGRQLAEITLPVDRSKLAELGRAFGDPDPVWHDPEAAEAAGVDAVPTMPTVTVLADHWRSGGMAGLIDAIGADLSRVLHGEAAWEYFVPVRMGDTLTLRASVSDVTQREGKRSGVMTMIKIYSAFTNQRGELAVTNLVLDASLATEKECFAVGDHAAAGAALDRVRAAAG